MTSASPATIFVGVPVFNGGKFLRAGLDCLSGQSFGDFEVHVFDNASSDDTGAIAKDFAARDPRFHYVRQSENKGAMQNFTDALLAAKGPYFLWRAADDLSSANYLEVLHGLLAAHPEKDLAVSRIVTRAGDGSVEIERPYRAGARLPGPLGVAERMALSYGASWFYGLFRRAAIAPIWLEVAARFGRANASDHLTMFPLLLDDRIIGSNATTFVQGVAALKDRSPRRLGEERHDDKIAARRIFLELTREQIARRRSNSASRAIHGGLAWFYANARVCAWNKVVRRSLQKRILQKRMGKAS